jgi:hypothetical protein
MEARGVKAMRPLLLWDAWTHESPKRLGEGGSQTGYPNLC